MNRKLLDCETILLQNEEWMKLEEEWGKPVDLDTEEDLTLSKLKPVFSTLDLIKTTFDSSFLFKKLRRKVSRKLSKKSILDYQDFIKDLQDNGQFGGSEKQFHFVNGQIISAFSVEELCDKIDDIFKSLEKLCSVTSTVRSKKIPEIVQCSISTEGLSFDDTVDPEKEKSDSDDIDRFIDEAFNQLNCMVSLREELDQSARESVTTLVKKFSTFLNNPAINCCPRKQKKCSSKFKELSDFWNNRESNNE